MQRDNRMTIDLNKLQAVNKNISDLKVKRMLNTPDEIFKMAKYRTQS